MVSPFYEVKMLKIVAKITTSDADRPVIPTMLLFKRKQARSGEEERDLQVSKRPTTRRQQT